MFLILQFSWRENERKKQFKCQSPPPHHHHYPFPAIKTFQTFQVFFQTLLLFLCTFAMDVNLPKQVVCCTPRSPANILE